MSVPRMRTINAAAQYFKEQDPGTCITKNFIRTGIKTGLISEGVVMAGGKYLISLETIETLLSKGSGIKPTSNEDNGKIVSYNGIRKINA